MFAAVDGRERMPDAGDRMTRRLDDALDPVEGRERARIVEHAGLAGLEGVAQACGAVALGGPADAVERGARPGDVEIGDAHDVEARKALGLRQEHRAELAGADQADANRAATRRALMEHG